MALQSVVLNEGLKTLGECKKENCSRIFSYTEVKLVKLPSTLRVLGDGTFYGCDNLRKVVFEEGSALKMIGTEAFKYCRSLKHIDLPKELEHI